MRRISEIFNDYPSSGNINTAILEEVIIRKDTKALEMKINAFNYIGKRNESGE